MCIFGYTQQKLCLQLKQKGGTCCKATRCFKISNLQTWWGFRKWLEPRTKHIPCLCSCFLDVHASCSLQTDFLYFCDIYCGEVAPFSHFNGERMSLSFQTLEEETQTWFGTDYHSDTISWRPVLLGADDHWCHQLKTCLVGGRWSHWYYQLKTCLVGGRLSLWYHQLKTCLVGSRLSLWYHQLKTWLVGGRWSLWYHQLKTWLVGGRWSLWYHQLKTLLHKMSGGEGACLSEGDSWGQDVFKARRAGKRYKLQEVYLASFSPPQKWPWSIIRNS